MKSSHPNHQQTLRRQVYFLTCWNEQTEAVQPEEWRFKLEVPGPSQPRLFKTLEEVMVTIKSELGRGHEVP
jgi:hypothetical protein